MTKRPAIRNTNTLLLIAASVFSIWVVATHVVASDARNGLIVVNWMLWATAVFTYPFGVLAAGEVIGTSSFSLSSRATEPARFWVGFVAMSAFWLAAFLYISLLSYMAWYRGA